jgi:hypothetical protein
MIMPTRIGFASGSQAQVTKDWDSPGIFLTKIAGLGVVMPNTFFEIESPSFFRGHSGPGDHPVAHAKLAAQGDGVPGIASNGWGAPNRKWQPVSTHKPSTWWLREYDWDETGSIMAYANCSAYSDREIRFSFRLLVARGYWNGTRPYHYYIDQTVGMEIQYTDNTHTGTPKIKGSWNKWEWSQRVFAPIREAALSGFCPWRWINSKLEVSSIIHYLEDGLDMSAEEGRVFRSLMHAGVRIPGQSSGALTLYDYAPKLPVAKPDLFVFNELDTKFYGVDPLLARRSYGDNAGYFLNAAVQRAYLDAIDRVPRLNDNSIANIAELCSFIYNLVVNHRVQMPASLSDAWLQYRYQYTTTKLDTKEAIDFVHRHMDIEHLESFSCHGSSHVSYGDVEGIVKCGFRVIPKDLRTLNRVWRALYTYGLEPNFYVVWDLIPYSFIVDWFIPVGDMAHAEDAQRNFKSTYECSTINYSVSYDVMKDGHMWHCYTRWQAPAPDSLNGLYFFEDEPKSKKVWGYRLLDAGSLILG